MRLVQGTTADDGNSYEKGLAALGLRLDEPLEPDFALWPENEQTVHVFARMLTQLNIADGGVVVGLKYESLDHVYRAMRIGQRRQRDIFPGLQVMEAAAVSELNRNRGN